MEQIRDNLLRVREQIKEVCLRIRRPDSEIDIIGVTKTKPASVIEKAIAAGISRIGENKVQEGATKKPEVTGAAEWHFIGHLQTNKVRKALRTFDLIQSVDSLRLAEKIDQESKKLGKQADVLLQINTSRETSKFGIPYGQTTKFIEQVTSSYSNINIKGLMTVGPLTDDRQQIRGSFRNMQTLFYSLQSASYPRMEMEHLSMGMTGDFEIAVEEGATLLRLGRVLFGERTG